MRWFPGLLLPVILLAQASRCGAETLFQLDGGGRIRGELLNPDERPRRSYVIQTTSGGRITLDRAQVKDVVEISPVLARYESIKPRVPDTVAAHLKMAEWCRERKLLAQRREHFQRIIELEPEHKEARAILGYLRQDDGRWLTREELMTERGFIYHKGKWRTQQAIDLLERNEQADKLQQEWFTKLKRLRSDLDKVRGRRFVKDELLAIKDPNAVRAISSFLERERDAVYIPLYYEMLANIGSPAAVEILRGRFIESADAEERETLLEYVVAHKSDASVRFFIKELKSKDNRKVNRAGYALGRLGDPVAVEPLIDALYTKHTYLVSTGGNNGGPGGAQTFSNSFSTNPNQSTGTINPFGSGGHSFGGGGPKYVKLTQKNPSVREALRVLTTKNFDFDTVAWKYWFASRQKDHQLDARRD